MYEFGRGGSCFEHEDPMFVFAFPLLSVGVVGTDRDETMCIMTAFTEILGGNSELEL